MTMLIYKVTLKFDKYGLSKDVTKMECIENIDCYICGDIRISRKKLNKLKYFRSNDLYMVEFYSDIEDNIILLNAGINKLREMINKSYRKLERFIKILDEMSIEM